MENDGQLTLDSVLDEIKEVSPLVQEIVSDPRAVRVLLYLFQTSSPETEAYINKIQAMTGVDALHISCFLSKGLEEKGVLTVRRNRGQLLKDRRLVYLELNDDLPDLFPLELIKAWNIKLK